MLFGWSGKLTVSRLENLKAPPTIAGVAWTTVLVWFMRIMAVLWLLKGLGGWAFVLGASGEAGGFINASLAQQTAIVFFAIVDLIAGVGLWMAAGWGGGVWILALSAHVAIALAMPRAISIGASTMVSYGALVAMFLVLAWAAAHHEEA
jgi:hypothetical protein